MSKYYARMSEEHITATLEAVMQKHDPTAAAITNEQERMIQEWGSDVIVLLSNQLSELQTKGGWYRSDQTLPPLNVRVRLWAQFLEDGKLSRGEESHGTRIAVFKSESWAREWIWDTPDGTTDESEDYGRRYTHWQYITPPEGE